MSAFASFSGDASQPAIPVKPNLHQGESRSKLCVIAVALAIGLFLSACQTPRIARPEPPPPAPPQVYVPPPPPAPPLRMDQPNYYRLRNTQAGMVPARVALLLPFSSPTANVRALAEALERAAELAVFDAQNRDILLMPRDDGGTPERAAAAASRAIDDGAEIIIGPLFAQSVAAVAPIARLQNVPVIALSTDRTVGGNGVYLLSFQPETEVNRIISYAARTGHNSFAALVPRTAYGDIVAGSFRESVARAGGRVADIETFEQNPEAVDAPARAAAQSGADAILIGEGGTMLQAVAPAIGAGESRRVKLLGTGLWDDAAVTREPMLASGWFAAPNPVAYRAFADHYRRTYGSQPPRIATLSYDAVSLIALLSRGQPYARFTRPALTDPDGFSGVDGIFRFRDDGSAERGLAILEVTPGGFQVVDPAPRAFPQPGF